MSQWIALIGMLCVVAAPLRAVEWLEEHCIHCHDESTSEGGLNLADLNLDADDQVNLAKWAKVYDRVAAGEMPPEGEERPKKEDIANFLQVTADTLNAIWAQRYPACCGVRCQTNSFWQPHRRESC
jgi:hypothetical protein